MDYVSKDSTVDIYGGATVTFRGSTITRNSVTSTRVEESVIKVYSSNPELDWSQNRSSILYLQETALSENNATYGELTAYVDSNAQHEAFIFSDIRRTMINASSASEVATLPLSEAPLDRPGIDASSEWLIGVQEVCNSGIT